MLEVVAAGPLATIQDGGRPGLAHLGVPRSGACDPWSLAVANLVMGNPPDSPALEITFGGLDLEASETCAVGLAGADLGAVASGPPERHLATGRVHRLARGERVRFDGGRRGIRAYLSLAGGIAAPRVLGSVSPVVGGDARLGADGAAVHRGTGLVPGDRLVPQRRGDLTAVGRSWPGARQPPTSTDRGRTPALPAERRNGPVLIEVVAGPDADRFAPGALESLVATSWTVAPTSDRMGIRLDGPPLTIVGIAEHLSVGMVWGAIQVPPDGVPIVLLADHQTVGGYPVLAVATTADRSALGQLRPGDAVRFELTTVEAAQAHWRDVTAALRQAAEALDRDAAWDTLALDARG